MHFVYGFARAVWAIVQVALHRDLRERLEKAETDEDALWSDQ